MWGKGIDWEERRGFQGKSSPITRRQHCLLVKGGEIGVPRTLNAPDLHEPRLKLIQLSDLVIRAN